MRAQNAKQDYWSTTLNGSSVLNANDLAVAKKFYTGGDKLFVSIVKPKLYSVVVDMYYNRDRDTSVQIYI